jgi:hypothetical protein
MAARYDEAIISVVIAGSLESLVFYSVYVKYKNATKNAPMVSAAIA